MIVFDLLCDDSGDRFEGWFDSTAEFDRQVDGEMIRCPACGSSRIRKAPMAPRIGRNSYDALARAQAELLKNSQWVGKDFANQARAMHDGERDSQPIHGEATLADAISLTEEGVPFAPLPFPVVPPGQVN